MGQWSPTNSSLFSLAKPLYWAAYCSKSYTLNQTISMIIPVLPKPFAEVSSDILCHIIQAKFCCYDSYLPMLCFPPHIDPPPHCHFPLVGHQPASALCQPVLKYLIMYHFYTGIEYNKLIINGLSPVCHRVANNHLPFRKCE